MLPAIACAIIMFLLAQHHAVSKIWRPLVVVVLATKNEICGSFADTKKIMAAD